MMPVNILDFYITDVQLSALCLKALAGETMMRLSPEPYSSRILPQSVSWEPYTRIRGDYSAGMPNRSMRFHKKRLRGRGA